MTISHHPDAATLMSFAAGGLPQTLSVVVASHVAVCTHCRRELALMERIGGALLAGLDAAHSDRAPVRTLVDPAAAPPWVEVGAVGTTKANATGEVPAPLAGLIGNDLDSMPWKRVLPGIALHQIRSPAFKSGYLVLVRAMPGRAIPDHGHGGSELTLVLRGAYRDEHGRYARGDCADLDEDVEHRPVADSDTGCICLVGSDGNPRLKGLLGRLMQPLIGR